jgi:hypothetical protein
MKEKVNIILEKNTVLIICWLVVSLINLNKAYHIDDTFHLEAGTYIIDHLNTPMSGKINWDNSPTEMYNHNQPPLFFLFIGIIIKLFNSNEITLHIFLSIFTLLALVYYNKILEILDVNKKYIYIILIAFNPAFIVNQNLMTDIPILAITFIFIFYLIEGLQSNKTNKIIISSIILSIGLLIKYTLIPYIILLILAIGLTKKIKNLLILAIPIATLCLWSLWNHLEYGGIHLIGRPRKAFNLEDVWAFLGTLGSISFFSILIIQGFFSRKISNILLVIEIISFIGLIIIFQIDIINEEFINKHIHTLFMIIGGITILSIIYKSIYIFINTKKINKLRYKFLIVTQIVGLTLFINLYAPFIATRHLLLILPFILILFEEEINKCGSFFENLLLLKTIVFGILIGVSDYCYADFYRKKAAEIQFHGHIIWTTGHWGWQWYAKKAGMKIYSQDEDWKLKKGDLLIIPKNIAKQTINENILLDTIAFKTEQYNYMTLISGKNFASLYNTFYKKPAWSLSKNTIDTIFIFKIKKGVPFRKKLSKEEEMINSIKKDKQWYELIKIKAIKNKISIDSMLMIDAKWSLENK